jgi:large subunit ribosomal protein L21
MYAVIKCGGKQHRVEPGSILRIERMDADIGSKVELNEVLLVSEDGQIKVGAPLIPKAKVQATVLGQDREKKIVVFKTKRKKQYRRTRGHRQNVTELRIDKIKA